MPPLAGLAAFASLYQAPALAPAGSETRSNPTGSTMAAIVVAGSVWGLYNAAISMIFSFGGLVLSEKGWAAGPASQTTSIVLWLTAISVPLGGILADRTGRPREVMIAGFVLFAALLVAAAQSSEVVLSLTALGLLCGISAGPIMSLPARVLTAPARNAGMGIFYGLFYLMVVLAPLVAGWAAAQAGEARIAFHLGAAMLCLCVAGVFVFEAIVGRASLGASG